MSESPDIAGYTVHRLLGKGGMAAVYLATQESLGRLVAIKVMSDFGDKKAEERFFSEARTIAALNHPRIVTVHELGHLADDRPFLTMEYLDGGDLRKLKGQSLSEHYALGLVRQIAEGLSVVHKKGIIHRDIKPGNILFRQDGSVALSDFGIAKNTKMDTELTQAGVSIGSPSYSSPEQICGKEIDQRSDIYSLGVVLLELLLGNNPFKGENYAEAVLNHTEKKLPDLSGIGLQYQTILKKMLAKQAKDRFATADELIQAIDPILTGAPDEDDATVQSSLTDSVIHPFMSVASLHYKKGAIFLGSIFVLFLLTTLLYESETDKEIASLIEKAETLIGQNQLIEPEFDNARYYYNQILTLDPENDDALDGLEEIDELLVERYLSLAAERFEETQLSLPKDDSAVFYYYQALSIDEKNQAALSGLERVAEKYSSLAAEAFNRKEYSLGHKHIRSGLKLSPENEELLQLKEQFKDKQNPFKRALDNFL